MLTATKNPQICNKNLVLKTRICYNMCLARSHNNLLLIFYILLLALGAEKHRQRKQ